VNSISVENLSAGYGSVQVLDGISLAVNDGETVTLLGTNGNGKSTLMKCIMGIVRPTSGRVRAVVDGVEHDLVGRAPEEIVELGISLVPRGGGCSRSSRSRRPAAGRLSQDRTGGDREEHGLLLRVLSAPGGAAPQLAGSMSGGEQQMLTLARALMTAPKILLVDEPSVGLAPILVIHTIDKIRELKESYRLTVLMAEQNFNQAIRIADRGYVIVHGRIEYQGGSREDLANNELIHKLYMGL